MCNKIHWSSFKELEFIGLNIILSPQMSFVLIIIYHPPSSNSTFYEKLEKLLKNVISTKNFKQITNNFDLMQLISGPQE